MENKTLKPGQLATIKDEFTGVRSIMRASKEFDEPCHKCCLQNDNVPRGMPCRSIMSMEKCRQMFGWHMFPIVIFSTLWEIKKR